MENYQAMPEDYIDPFYWENAMYERCPVQLHSNAQNDLGQLCHFRYQYYLLILI